MHFKGFNEADLRVSVVAFDVHTAYNIRIRQYKMQPLYQHNRQPQHPLLKIEFMHNNSL